MVSAEASVFHILAAAKLQAGTDLIVPFMRNSFIQPHSKSCDVQKRIRTQTFPEECCSNILSKLIPKYFLGKCLDPGE